MINQYAQQMAQQGLSLDQYLKIAGITLDGLGEQVRPEAEKHIRQDLVLDAIAEAEKIEVSDEDVDAEIENMAKMYQMEVEQLKGYVTENERENMKQDIASRRALEIIAAGMKPRPKAAEEEDASAAEPEED